MPKDNVKFNLLNPYAIIYAKFRKKNNFSIFDSIFKKTFKRVLF